MDIRCFFALFAYLYRTNFMSNVSGRALLVAGCRSLHSEHAEVSLASSETRALLVFVLTAGAEPAVQSPVNVECQTERVTTVTAGGEGEISWRQKRYINHPDPLTSFIQERI